MKGAVHKSGDLRVETLRGLAIIAVVANHVGLWQSKALAGAGLDPAITSLFGALFTDFLTPLRMPLFTVLSGWVYALRPFTPDNTALFFHGKFRRIIIPLFFVSTVMYFLILALTSEQPGIVGTSARAVEPNEFWIMWFYHFGHLWFLQVLIVLFIMIAVIDTLGWMNTVKQWVFWLVASALLFYVYPRGIEFWSLGRVVNIMVFFLFGVGLYRFKAQIFNPTVIKLAAVVFIVSMFAHYFKTQENGGRFWPLIVLAGTTGPITLLALNFTWRPLIWIGEYSYSIYLYHGIAYWFIGPFFLGLLSTHSTHWIWFAIVLFSSLTLPIILDSVGEKIPYIRTPLLGRRP